MSVFDDGRRQSKELEKGLTPDTQRLCDSPGLEPIAKTNRNKTPLKRRKSALFFENSFAKSYFATLVFKKHHQIFERLGNKTITKE